MSFYSKIVDIVQESNEWIDLDLKKVLDKVPHKILLCKLKKKTFKTRKNAWMAGVFLKRLNYEDCNKRQRILMKASHKWSTTGDSAGFNYVCSPHEQYD